MPDRPAPPPDVVIAAFSAVGTPRLLAGGRRTSWRVGDLVLKPLDMSPPEMELQAAVLSAMAQLVHGDLSGNVLFAPGLAPAIIDFSPYWRPKPYASAVVAVDAVAWFGAGPEVLEDVLARPEGDQLLIRALLFWMLSAGDPAAGAPGYQRVANHL